MTGTSYTHTLSSSNYSCYWIIISDYISLSFFIYTFAARLIAFYLIGNMFSINTGISFVDVLWSFRWHDCFSTCFHYISRISIYRLGFVIISAHSHYRFDLLIRYCRALFRRRSCAIRSYIFIFLSHFDTYRRPHVSRFRFDSFYF